MPFSSAITRAADSCGDACALVQAARAALSAAADTAPAKQAEGRDEERELPAFGSGLEFRPQGKLAASKGGAATAEAAAPANDGSLAISLEEENEEAEEDDMGDDKQVRFLILSPCMDEPRVS